MATITKRKTGSGEIRYRVQIRIKRKGKVVHAESRTFANLATAKGWARAREVQLDQPGEIERILHPQVTVGQLIEDYLTEVIETRGVGRSKYAALNQLKTHDIADLDALNLTTKQVLQHLTARRRAGTGPATVGQDLIWLRIVLKYARRVWGLPVEMQPLEDATETAWEMRLIARSKRRNRRPTADELKRLTEYFQSRKRSKIPMDLVIWFAIYSARRQGEIFRIRRADLHPEVGSYLVRDVKHPDGSEGNHKHATMCARGWAVVEEIRARVGEDDPKLLPSTSKTAGTYFTRACRVLGIEDLHFHDLRHEACSRMAEDGKTIPEIQAVSLHDSWSSLQRYVQVTRQTRVEWEEVHQGEADTRAS